MLWVRHIPRRIRLRLALLAVLALLMQQTALAAYACAPLNVTAGDVAMAVHCEDLPMAQAAPDTGSARALCKQHCTFQAPKVEGVQALDVPPSTLPAILPVSATVVALSPAPAVRPKPSAGWASSLAPALRYRVLLI